jgi:ABC-type multidrug transport system ATPase subunit
MISSIWLSPVSSISCRTTGVGLPVVLFLDEPTVGLDPQTRTLVWEDVLRLRREEQMTIFLTSHYMDEAEMCSATVPDVG